MKVNFRVRKKGKTHVRCVIYLRKCKHSPRWKKTNMEIFSYSAFWSYRPCRLFAWRVRFYASVRPWCHVIHLHLNDETTSTLLFFLFDLLPTYKTDECCVIFKRTVYDGFRISPCRGHHCVNALLDRIQPAGWIYFAGYYLKTSSLEPSFLFRKNLWLSNKS